MNTKPGNTEDDVGMMSGWSDCSLGLHLLGLREVLGVGEDVVLHHGGLLGIPKDIGGYSGHNMHALIVRACMRACMTTTNETWMCEA